MPRIHPLDGWRTETFTMPSAHKEVESVAGSLLLKFQDAIRSLLAVDIVPHLLLSYKMSASASCESWGEVSLQNYSPVKRSENSRTMEIFR